MSSSVLGIVLLLGLAAGACGGDASLPTAPSSTAPSPVQPVSPAPTPLAGHPGYVMDSAGRPIGGARVEALDGAQAGHTIIADAQGQFSVPRSFDDMVTFRASADGHVSATNQLRGNGSFRWLGFNLGVLASPADVSGQFTIVVAADPNCLQLPNEFHRRTYPAAIARVSVADYPADTQFRLVASGATFRDWDAINIGVAGNYLAFWDDGHGTPFLTESLPDGGTFAFAGTASAHVETPVTTISVSFAGSITHRSGDGATKGCTSNNHRIILTRVDLRISNW